MKNVFAITIEEQQQGICPLTITWTASDGIQSGNTLKGQFFFTDTLERLQQLHDEHQHLEYGQILGEAIFQGQIREKFLDAVKTQPEILSVRLEITPELEHLHWQKLIIAPFPEVGKNRKNFFFENPLKPCF